MNKVVVPDLLNYLNSDHFDPTFLKTCMIFARNVGRKMADTNKNIEMVNAMYGKTLQLSDQLSLDYLSYATMLATHSLTGRTQVNLKETLFNIVEMRI